MFYYNLDKYYRKGYINRNFGKDIIAQSLREVKEKMLKNFKTTKVKLGDYQKLVRGDKEIPIWGMQDVITAMNASNYKDGKIRVTHGESLHNLQNSLKTKLKLNQLSLMVRVITRIQNITQIRWIFIKTLKLRK